MQLYREITEYRAGEGESFIEVRQNGKRCTIVEKVIGRKSTTTDIDANGAAYYIVERMDYVKRLTNYQKDELHLHSGRDEPQIHPRLKDLFDNTPRMHHCPKAAQLVWSFCHPHQEAA